MIWVHLRGGWRLLWLLPVLLYATGAWCLAQTDLNIATWGAFLWLLAIALAGYFLISAGGDEPSARSGQSSQESEHGAQNQARNQK